MVNETALCSVTRSSSKDPTGQHSGSVLKPSLFYKANWICFSGQNSTNMDTNRFYYKSMGFISWKYETFPKPVSVLLNEVSSSRSRKVGILIVLFSWVRTEKSSEYLKMRMGSLNNGHIKSDSLEGTKKESRVQLPDGEKEVVQSCSRNSKGNRRPANCLLKSMRAGRT